MAVFAACTEAFDTADAVYCFAGGAAETASADGILGLSDVSRRKIAVYEVVFPVLGFSYFS